MKKKTLKNKQKKKKNVMIFLKENKKINKNSKILNNMEMNLK